MATQAIQTPYKQNDSFKLRFSYARKILGKDIVIKTTEENEDGEPVAAPKKRTGGLTRDDMQKLEFKALVSEGAVLQRRSEYIRAITAYTTAIEKEGQDEERVLVDRANCYIKIGSPDLALKDVDRALEKNPKDARAILTKAEAYFAMGEFEFALVFFNRGKRIRKDILAFREGATKSTHAILDAIKEKPIYQPNQNFGVSNARKPFLSPSEQGPIRQENPQEIQKLLPEPVPALPTKVERRKYLGELSVDYDYLLELREEVKQNLEKKSCFRKDEEEKIGKLVEDTLIYLDQRSAFWSQQGLTLQEVLEMTKKKSQQRARTQKSVNESRLKQEMQNLES